MNPQLRVVAFDGDEALGELWLPKGTDRAEVVIRKRVDREGFEVTFVWKEHGALFVSGGGVPTDSFTRDTP